MHRDVFGYLMKNSSFLHPLFLLQNQFVWEVILNTRHSVSSGYKPFRLKAHLKRRTKLFKPRAYKRQFTVLHPQPIEWHLHEHILTLITNLFVPSTISAASRNTPQSPVHWRHCHVWWQIWTGSQACIVQNSILLMLAQDEIHFVGGVRGLERPSQQNQIL